MGEQLKNLKCIKQRIISGFFRTINNEFHGFRYKIIILHQTLNFQGDIIKYYLNFILFRRQAGANCLTPSP